MFLYCKAVLLYIKPGLVVDIGLYTACIFEEAIEIGKIHIHGAALDTNITH